MKEIFTERNSCYNLRNISRISLSKPKTNCYGIESATYMGPSSDKSLQMTLKHLLASQYLRKRLKLGKIQNATADYANFTLRRLDS